MSRIWIAGAGLLLALSAQQAAAQTPAADDYAWAGACKGCHKDIYESWEKTKHARTASRLSGSEREPGKCVGCHVTGPPELMAQDVNANVQCEGCHGPGKAHIAAATGGAAKPGKIARVPAESVCVRCHNDGAGTHFKYFSYTGMKNFVHPVGK